MKTTQQLLPLVCDEWRRLVGARLANERAGQKVATVGTDEYPNTGIKYADTDTYFLAALSTRSMRSQVA